MTNPSSDDGWRIDSAATGGWRLRLQVSKHDGYLGHSVWLVSKSKPALRLLSAAEGPPVFQEAHLQAEGAAGELLFLTGMSGKTYWSASVATVQDGGRPGLELDVAYRSPTDLPEAASHYHLPKAAAATATEKGILQLTIPDAPACMLAPGIVEGANLCASRITPAGLAISAPADSPARRWAFRLLLAGTSA